MSYTSTYSNQAFDYAQQAASLMNPEAIGYTDLDFTAVELLIQKGSGPMPSPRELADMASAQYECAVCHGEGEIEVELEIETECRYTTHKETITCEDCDGRGTVDVWIHFEHTGEREGTVNDWVDSMAANKIEQIVGVM
jgi:hypothetical protein